MTKGKPELLVTAKNMDEVEKLIEAGADAIAIGSEKYALRTPGDFSLDMIKEAVEIAHEKQAKVYVLMNALFHNEMLVGIEQYVKSLAEYGVDAIVFGDPAIIVTVRSIAPQMKLHWNTETTSTNYQTVNYWAKKGATRAILARELSFDEVKEIKNNADVEIQAQIHGLTCIFHSKRNLLSNYLTHIGKSIKGNLSKEGGLFLREHKRPDERYPVFEDVHGTHIMSDHDICMIEHIPDFIDAEIDSLKIEGLMHSTEYLIEITRIYRQAIDNANIGKETKDLLQAIEEIQPKDKPLTTGFYFKEQYY